MDGALPSNVGGGGNIRNVLRRTFKILHDNKWWDIIGMEGFLEIFEYHKKDMEGVFGAFPGPQEYFHNIMKVEYNRWKFADEDSVKKLEKIIK